MRKALHALITTNTTIAMIALALASHTALGAVAPGAPKVLVVAFGDATPLAGAMRQAVGNVAHKAVVPAATTTIDLQAASDSGVSCGPEADDCLVKLGLFAQVDQVVTATAVHEPSGLALHLLLVDVALAKRTGDVQRKLASTDDDTAVADAVAELLVPEAVVGSVHVDTTPTGAMVLVDGAKAGTAPLVVRAHAGAHTLAAVDDDAHRTSAPITVDVVAGSETKATLVLTDASAPPHPRAPPVAGEPAAGLSPVVVAIGGGALVVVGAATVISIEAILSTTSLGEFPQRSAMLTGERVAALVGAVGAVVAGAAGVAIVLDGADGDAQGTNSSAPASRGVVRR